MTNAEREKKKEIFLKIANLVQLASALGEVIEDEQTMFLANTLQLVLVAGSDVNDSRRFSEHCLNYINEKLMEKGELEVEKHLLENVIISDN